MLPSTPPAPARRRLASLISLALAAALTPAHAQFTGFTGAFAPENWMFTSGGLEADGTISSTQLTLTGSRTGDSMITLTTYSIKLSDSYRISFDWSFTSYDISPEWDPAGFSHAWGHQLTDDGGELTQSGSVTNAYFGGGTFAFYASSDNWGNPLDGASHLEITNFRFSFADPDDDGTDNYPDNGGATIGGGGDGGGGDGGGGDGGGGLFEHYWTGATDNNWSTAGNWSDGVPTSETSTGIFDATVDITSSAEAYSIYLENSTLNVTANGVLKMDADEWTSLAADHGSVLQISGEDARWEGGSLTLYTATAIFDEGATITTTEANLATIWDDNIASATVKNGAEWTTGSFNIAGAGAASITVDGGTLIALDTSSINLNGSLVVTNGGTLQTGMNENASLLISAGSLTVTKGGTWTSPTSAIVGFGGEGTLTISEGGQVTLGYIEGGRFSGDHGIITIDGPGSKLTTTGLYHADYDITSGDILGSFGTATITITNGGHYHAQAPELFLGYENSGYGTTVTVSGDQSQFTVDHSLNIATFGEATLVISDGATATAGQVLIAWGSLNGLAGNIKGTATVTDAGSTWRIGDSLDIGSYSSPDDYTIGTLNIADGGTVTVADGTGAIQLELNSVINIGTGGTAGTLQAGSLALGGALAFNHTDNISFDIPISDYNPTIGSGVLLKTGTGTLTLAGEHTYTGQTNVTGGTLNLTGDISASSLTTISDQGTLSGTGTVGTLTIADGGTLAPGNSLGTLSAGYTIFESGGTFALEIAGTTGYAGTAYDLLSISGNLFLPATADSPFVIDLISLNGLVAGALADFDPTADYFFTFVTTTDGIHEFSSDIFSILTDRFTNPFTGSWSVLLTNSGHDLTLAYTGAGASAIPEPSTYAAILGGIALLAAIARRRLRSARSCSCG